MATDITEALQGAGAVSAKPVTMEAIPEATIDVGGGSQSLDIEGLGVKRRKDDLSVATASTSGIAVEDLFGDLLDEVNFSDPTSVDAFRESAASRINEFDSNTFSSILGEASTIAGDLATFTSQFQRSSQPQQQFEQVFRPLSVTSGDDAGDIGLDTATSTEAQDISSLTNPGLAASLVGSGIGAFGTGASISDFGASLASGALSSTGVAGVFGGFNAAQSLANAEITDLPSALSATSAALAVGQTAANVDDLVNSNVTVTGLFEQAAKNVGEYIEGIYTAVTNPAQAMEAYGMEMQYGTQTPALFSYNLPSGQVNFAFDKKTGQLVTPGFIQAMLPAPMRAAFNLAQVGMEAIGYTEEVSDRAVGMSNAFSTAGVSLSQGTADAAGLTGFSDPSTQTNVNAIDVDFSSVPGAIGSLQFDMNALASQVAGQGVTANNISIEDVNQAAVVQTMLDFEDVDLANSALQNSLNNYATSRGIDNSIESISEQMGIESMAASQAFAEDYNALAATVGMQGFNLDFDSSMSMGYDAAENVGKAAQAEALALSLASQYSGFSTAGKSAIGAAVTGFNRDFTTAFDAPTPAGIQSLTEEARQAAVSYYGKKDEEIRAAELRAQFEGAGQAAAEDYNSQMPSIETLDAMEHFGYRSISPNANEDLGKKANIESYQAQKAAKAAADKADREATEAQEQASGLSFGYGDEAPSIGTAGVSAPGYEAAGAAAAAEAAAAEAASVAAGVASYDIGFGSDSDSGSDADGGGGDTYICTAAFNSGVSPVDRFRANRKYGIKLRRNDPLLMRGYDRVGPWLATKVGHTKVGNVLTQLYAKKANNEKLNLKYKLLDSILNLTTRPALRLIGRFA